ncbi:MAG: hypothetical protein LBG92_10460 [Prevotellaceae bacterium]|nr:hypothetical protein [Prevotellaceae bacterium]
MIIRLNDLSQEGLDVLWPSYRDFIESEGLNLHSGSYLRRIRNYPHEFRMRNGILTVSPYMQRIIVAYRQINSYRMELNARKAEYLKSIDTIKTATELYGETKN